MKIYLYHRSGKLQLNHIVYDEYIAISRYFVGIRGWLEHISLRVETNLTKIPEQLNFLVTLSCQPDNYEH